MANNYSRDTRNVGLSYKLRLRKIKQNRITMAMTNQGLTLKEMIRFLELRITELSTNLIVLKSGMDSSRMRGKIVDCRAVLKINRDLLEDIAHLIREPIRMVNRPSNVLSFEYLH